MVLNAAEVAKCLIVPIEGTFQRHTSVKITDLSGSRFGGRWGPANSFPVLYLGRPVTSVAAEAYRHLVDPVGGMSGSKVGPRKLWTCAVALSSVLDLRDEPSRKRLGITTADLTSDVREYAKCNQIAVIAHQLELHAILAPSATLLGETLAIFDQHLPLEEVPSVTSVELWNGLPNDPRRLRLVDPLPNQAEL